MHSHIRCRHPLHATDWSTANIVLTLLLTPVLLTFLILFLTITAQPAMGQSYTILHTFTGAGDGATPTAGVTLDATGNLYGTTSQGGYLGNQYSCASHGGCGIVFKLTHSNDVWRETVLHTFTGLTDGATPYAGVVFGPDGQLYGAASVGGLMGEGAVFSLRPPATACQTALCNWTETMIVSLGAGSCYGAIIGYGNVAFDPAGLPYETSIFAGDYDVGTIFNAFGGYCGFQHSFNWGTEGGNTQAGVTFVGYYMYGVATNGGPYSKGTVYGYAGGVNVIHAFENGDDGAYPFASLAADAAGNLYGTTSRGGPGDGGTVFEVTPSGSFSVLYSFTGGGNSKGSLSFDTAGNMYGTLCNGGAQSLGSIFKLTPGTTGWSYTSLHDFSGIDGACPYGSVSLDSDGNLYGTASGGGAYGKGVVWEITP
jgi:uncharacterized repeat protein (TIGR03803 family)